MKKATENRERAAIKALKAFAAPDEDCLAIYFGPIRDDGAPAMRSILFAREPDGEDLVQRIVLASLQAAAGQMKYPALDAAATADEKQALAEQRAEGLAALMAAYIGLELKRADCPIATPPTVLVCGAIAALLHIAPRALIADWLADPAMAFRLDESAEPDLRGAAQEGVQTAWQALEAAAAAFVNEAAAKQGLYWVEAGGRA